jgi:hypothetical protein
MVTDIILVDNGTLLQRKDDHQGVVIVVTERQ